MNNDKDLANELAKAWDDFVDSINETPPFSWVSALASWAVDKLTDALERVTHKEDHMENGQALGGISTEEATENLRRNMELLNRPPLPERTREKFREIFKEKVAREGATELLEWMDRNGFFEAPASTKHHLAIRGGLALHSLNVYRRLVEIVEREMVDKLPAYPAYLPPELAESVAIMGLLHDLCKTDCYHESQEKGYTFRDPLPMGHGEKSVYMITKYMKLLDTEAMAIRWHMGAYDDAVKGGSKAFNDAMKLTPWVWRLHQADMNAAWEDERSGDNGIT